MREIKFRAWDDKAKIMWTHEMIDESDAEGIVMFGDLFKKSTEFKLMQFIGCYDCNGKEIYEGDLIKVVSKPINLNKKIGLTFSIIFNTGGYYIRLEEINSWPDNTYNKPEIGSTYPINNLKDYKCYIIGNIYE